MLLFAAMLLASCHRESDAETYARLKHAADSTDAVADEYQMKLDSLSKLPYPSTQKEWDRQFELSARIEDSLRISQRRALVAARAVEQWMRGDTAATRSR